MRLRVLIVDDNASMRHRLEELVVERLPGVLTESVGTVHEAVERVRHERWHVVLLDVNLPDGNGILAIPTLLALTPGLPIIIVSALAEPPYAAAAVRAGALAFIAKERAAETLMAAVLQAVSRAS
jgi:DNA-binding NarL/FixJ family response regulator